MDENCIFCKLANGVFSTRTVYEDEDFRVIMDADPATKGHSLLLPKRHFANLYEMDDETAKKALPVIKKVATHLKDALGCDGLNVVQNNGEAAGQTVFHYHVHMIPRYADGNPADVSWSHSSFTDEEFDAILDQIKM